MTEDSEDGDIRADTEDSGLRAGYFSNEITLESCMCDVAEIRTDDAAVFVSSTTFRSGVDGGLSNP